MSNPQPFHATLYINPDDTGETNLIEEFDIGPLLANMTVRERTDFINSVTDGSLDYEQLFIDAVDAGTTTDLDEPYRVGLPVDDIAAWFRAHPARTHTDRIADAARRYCERGIPLRDADYRLRDLVRAVDAEQRDAQDDVDAAYQAALTDIDMNA